LTQTKHAQRFAQRATTVQSLCQQVLAQKIYLFCEKKNGARRTAPLHSAAQFVATSIKMSAKSTLYSQIEHAFSQLECALDLSVKFQQYSNEAYKDKVPSAAQNKRLQRRLFQKWRSMHSDLDKALTSVVAHIDPPVLQSFDNEHIVLVFYSVVANYAIDASNNDARERCWPKLDGADDVTAQAYKLSRSIEKSLVTGSADSVGAQNASRVCAPRRKKPAPYHTPNKDCCCARIAMRNDRLPCTSTGYFAEGCRVQLARKHT
jgi:hypothetical protein